MSNWYDLETFQVGGQGEDHKSNHYQPECKSGEERNCHKVGNNSNNPDNNCYPPGVFLRCG